MVKPIVKDVLFLGQKSERSTVNDKQVVTDLQDTLSAHRDRCVGAGMVFLYIESRKIGISSIVLRKDLQKDILVYYSCI